MLRTCSSWTWTTSCFLESQQHSKLQYQQQNYQFPEHNADSSRLMSWYCCNNCNAFTETCFTTTARWKSETDAKKILTASPFAELEETTRIPSYYVDDDYPAGPEIQYSPWMKPLTWLRIVHTGDWRLRLVLHTPSNACHKRRSMPGKRVEVGTGQTNGNNQVQRWHKVVKVVSLNWLQVTLNFC